MRTMDSKPLPTGRCRRCFDQSRFLLLLVVVICCGMVLAGCRPQGADRGETGRGPADSIKSDGAATSVRSPEGGSVTGGTPSDVEVPGAEAQGSRATRADQADDSVDGGSTGRSDPGKEPEPVGSDQVREDLFAGWPTPELVIVLTGRQDGYLEPCGCTGLENQKGGVARRATFLEGLREERGWPVLPVDVGNQVRRYGRQAEIKFQVSADALRKMGYGATTLGLQDLQLSIDELAATSAALDDAEPLFISANVAVLDPDFTPRMRVVEVGGKRIGITACLGDEARSQIQADELILSPAAEALQEVWEELRAADCDYHILLAQCTTEETIALAQAVPHFQLIVTSGGSDEPSFEPRAIPETESLMVNVGAKAMFACAVGLFDDPEQPWRYERIPMDDRFEDAREMRELMANYQKELERMGLEQLGLTPVAHPSGREFVGSATCGDCHTTAYGIWEGTPHHHATQSIVDPYERNDVPRHFDPECLSCHVTGWNPQRYFPYESGYLSLTVTPRMTGNGCENCHGPGSAHVAAEMGEVDVDAVTLESLREQMRLPLAEAEKKCLECHDLDNSPDFHVPGAFQRYWEQIEHWGKD